MMWTKSGLMLIVIGTVMFLLWWYFKPPQVDPISSSTLKHLKKLDSLKGDVFWIIFAIGISYIAALMAQEKEQKNHNNQITLIGRLVASEEESRNGQFRFETNDDTLIIQTSPDDDNYLHMYFSGSVGSKERLIVEPN